MDAYLGLLQSFMIFFRLYFYAALRCQLSVYF